MAHYNVPLLIIIPEIHNLECLYDDKITHYTNKTLLNFVEIYSQYIAILYLLYHYTSMIHILCTLCQNLTNLEIICDCSLANQLGHGLSLHQCFAKKA